MSLCECIFPSDYVARAVYALFTSEPPLNFSRQLARALFFNTEQTIDLSKHLSPTQLETFLACLRGIDAELAPGGNPSMPVKAAFQGFRKSKGSSEGEFALQFDFSYGCADEENLQRPKAHVARGHAVLLSAVLKTLKEALPEGRPHTAISLGCGEGRLTAQYAGELTKGSRLLLLDLHAGFLRQAEERLSTMAPALPLVPSWADTAGPAGGIASVSFDLHLLSEHQHLPGVDSETVDFVETSLTLHHAMNFDVVCAEIARVLRPSGTLFFLDALDDIEGFVSSEPPEIAQNAILPTFHGIELYRTQKEVVESLANAGLVVTQIYRVDPSYTFIAAVKKHI